MTRLERPEDRFVALVAEHRGILYRVASGYCRVPEERRDLMQEMVLQLYRSFARYDERQRFSTWMYRVALNVAVSFHRGERRRTGGGAVASLEDLGFELGDADAVSESVSDDARLLRTLIHQLEPIDRALVLLYLEGHGHEETAEIVGISSTSVSTRIHRLKEKLQRQFDAMSVTKERES